MARDYVIKLGTMLFTMVEPEKGFEVEYNRWYERDHFYGGVLTGAWSFAGDRFVATRTMKDLRYPAESVMTPDPLSGSYLGVYWVLDGKHDEWNRWSVDTVKMLHATGRMFAERKHIHTLLYHFTWSIQKNEWGCPAELALDHNYAGLVVNVGELLEGATHDDLEAWTRNTWAPGALASDWGPDLVVNATPLPLLDDAPPDVPRTVNAERRFLQLHFLDHAPDENWEAGYGQYGAQLNASGVATHLWTSPFIQTIVGTDTHTDQLW